MLELIQQKGPQSLVEYIKKMVHEHKDAQPNSSYNGSWENKIESDEVDCRLEGERSYAG